MQSADRGSGLALRIARLIAAVLSVPYGILLAAYTFAPESGPQLGVRAYNVVPLRTIIEQANSGDGADEFIRQIGGNFVLLLPLGVVLGLFRVATDRAVFVVVATALAIELLQFGLVPSRSADIDDALLNIAGGFVGLLVGRGVSRALAAR